ncbi:endolytic transglycosylase MltG [Pseudoflavonifractor sp. 60]|uniref:endolytic transglycosylase MltG n=1 Tax=Pseudoflavonifractor sp. 60 TaxID=2304576 RepID=UPI001371829C|nr:endolytic transglycosylase MltG [Pseudoflavonifractor sp. 60]NBI68363.1 endolytic transglycosylase MltG [Pseudoflavonifractor sp. 60]
MSQDYYESRERQSSQRSSSGEGEPRRRRKKRRSAGRTAALVLLYVAAVIGASVLLACAGWIAAGDVLALNKEEKVVSFTVTPEDDFDSVADRLKEEGLIEYRFLFDIFATITHKKDTLDVGTYTLSTDMDYRALLAGMRANSANRAQVTVVIPEGYTTDQIFSLLEEKGVSTVEELREAAANHDYAFSFLQDIPLGDYHRLEGYLMPATYDFYTPHDPVYALNKFLVYFDSQVSDNVREQVEKTDYTLHEILTVASMIERETTGDDRTDIASVIYNRLNNPNAGPQGYLQIDATLVYINGGKEPTEADKSIDSPYNTYLYQGLPVGPIANPGMESIVAAMNPSSSKNYYYALGDDNIHHFFQSYDQFQRFISSQERYKG